MFLSLPFTMLTNYYTLRWIAEDLNRTLAGAQLTQLFTQQRDELVITCATHSEQYCLVVSCRKSLNYMYLRDAFPRAKKNSVDIFPSLVGARIREVSVHPYDRELFLDTNMGARLAIRPHGSSANVLLIDKARIQDAFLNRKELVGTVYADQQETREPGTLEQFHERLQQANTLYRSLKALFPRYGSEVVRELLFLCGLAEDTAASTLNRQQVELLWNTSRKLEQLLLERAAPRVYFERTLPKTFSIIPLNHLHALRCEEYESIHTAIRTFIGLTHRQHEFEQRRRALMQRLRSSLERDERLLERSIDEAGERARQYETMGKLLMAHLDILHKGMREVVLENTVTSNPAQLTITLDPALSPAKNAERYFDKAKAARQKSAEQAKKKDRLQRRVQSTRNLLERLESVDDADVFEKFLDKHRTELEEVGCAVDEKTKPQKQEAPLFRVFTVAGGFQVWAGKSSENNDLLTLKHAKPNDLWFHARGSSGSHVVLKIGTGKGEPSKLAIQQAAGIAAYYSKMKNSKLVPVSMTERKYVRKPKGAPAGTVTLERETTIFAEPKLPPNAAEDV
jgi:predicted ribosome quality control (RQC) complex YloA/Tae2 family protein